MHPLAEAHLKLLEAAAHGNVLARQLLRARAVKANAKGFALTPFVMTSETDGMSRSVHVTYPKNWGLEARTWWRRMHLDIEAETKSPRPESDRRPSR